MKLFRGIRHWYAHFMVAAQPEWGAMLHDYNNGNWSSIMIAQTEEESKQMLEIVDNMLHAGRDAIYLCSVKVGPRHGYFCVFTSNKTMWTRAFWGNVYTAEDAYIDTALYCRKVANKMGFVERKEQ
jgi:hypothetical protein